LSVAYRLIPYLSAGLLLFLIGIFIYSLAEWPSRRLGEVATVKCGATPKTDIVEFWNGDLIWVTPKDLGALDSIEISTTERRITKAGFDSCSVHHIPVNSVVMSSRAPIGHLAINTVPVCTNQGCKSFVPKPGLMTRYLYWALRAVMSQIQHLGDGATFDEVSKRDLEAFGLPVPPIVEQERLVKRIEALSSRAQELRGLNSSLTEDSARILSAEYIRISRDAPIHRFGEIAKLLRRHVTTIPKETYLEMGVRSFWNRRDL
jgi:type I restriction enzyme S subunit